MITTQAGAELESFEHHRESDTYRSRSYRETTSPNMAVIASLSAVRDSGPTEPDLLYAFVDTDALHEEMEDEPE